MATAPQLDPLTEVMINDLMASGRFAERTDVLRHGVKLAHDEDQLAHEPLDAETIALLEERLAEADANPEASLPAEQVFRELRQRYETWK